MENHISLGRKGEEIAFRHLVGKNFLIRDRNWRHGKKELDIVAEKDGFLVIVEVKTRSNGFEDPREAVTIRKQKNIVAAADAYAQAFNIDNEVRFDIITVEFENNQHTIEHIEDAFYALL